MSTSRHQKSSPSKWDQWPDVTCRNNIKPVNNGWLQFLCHQHHQWNLICFHLVGVVLKCQHTLIFVSLYWKNYSSFFFKYLCLFYRWWFFFSKVIELLDTVCILKQYCNRSFNKRFICLRFTSHLPVSRFEYKQNLTFNEIINIVYILKFDCALPCCLYNTNI